MTMWLRVGIYRSGSDSPRIVPGESRWFRLHVCHVSSPEGVEEVTRALRKVRMLLVNPARITLCWIPSVRRNRYSGEVFTADPRSGNQKGMWEKLFNGEIDCLVSDPLHARRK